MIRTKNFALLFAFLSLSINNVLATDLGTLNPINLHLKKVQLDNFDQNDYNKTVWTSKAAVWSKSAAIDAKLLPGGFVVDYSNACNSSAKPTFKPQIAPHLVALIDVSAASITECKFSEKLANTKHEKVQGEASLYILYSSDGDNNELPNIGSKIITDAGVWSSNVFATTTMANIHYIKSELAIFSTLKAERPDDALDNRALQLVLDLPVTITHTSNTILIVVASVSSAAILVILVIIYYMCFRHNRNVRRIKVQEKRSAKPRAYTDSTNGTAFSPQISGGSFLKVFGRKDPKNAGSLATSNLTFHNTPIFSENQFSNQSCATAIEMVTPPQAGYDSLPIPPDLEAEVPEYEIHQPNFTSQTENISESVTSSPNSPENSTSITSSLHKDSEKPSIENKIASVLSDGGMSAGADGWTLREDLWIQRSELNGIEGLAPRHTREFGKLVANDRAMDVKSGKSLSGIREDGKYRWTSIPHPVW